MGHANWLKSLVLAAKCPYGAFLRKNGGLGELGHRGFVVFLVVDWVCYMFMILRRVAFGEDYGLEFL